MYSNFPVKSFGNPGGNIFSVGISDGNIFLNGKNFPSEKILAETWQIYLLELSFCWLENLAQRWVTV